MKDEYLKPTLRPSVTVSYAQTLDGRLASASGSSQWISGPESLQLAHQMRASHDAIMVGVGTVCQDDPRLTVRLVPGRDPLRVVVDSTLRIPPTAAILSPEAAPGTILATTDRAPTERIDVLRARGAVVLQLPPDENGRVALAALLSELDGRGVGTVMVEGGAGLITALLRVRLVDRLAVCVAPKLLGTGIEAVGDLGIRDLARALTLAETTVTPCGVDIVIDGRVVYPEEDHGR